MNIEFKIITQLPINTLAQEMKWMDKVEVVEVATSVMRLPILVQIVQTILQVSSRAFSSLQKCTVNALHISYQRKMKR